MRDRSERKAPHTPHGDVILSHFVPAVDALCEGILLDGRIDYEILQHLLDIVQSEVHADSWSEYQSLETRDRSKPKLKLITNRGMA